MKSYGTTSKISITNNLDYHIEEIYHKGFTIIENQLQKNDIPIFKNKIKYIYQEQTKKFSKKDLKSIGDLNIGDKYKHDPHMNKILGYKWDTPRSVDEYRFKKIRSLNR